MGDLGFFDLQHHYKGLEVKSAPLVAILATVPFELFSLRLKTALVKGGLTKKHGKSYFGDKSHISVDRRRNLVRRYAVSSASVHDPYNNPAACRPIAPIAVKSVRRCLPHAR
jgi:hypothetical protein